MQVPKYAQPGKPGRELNVVLELKTIADVGLVGFPNVGKLKFLPQKGNHRLLLRTVKNICLIGGNHLRAF